MNQQNDMRIKLQQEAQDCLVDSENVDVSCLLRNKDALQDLTSRHELTLAQQDELVESVVYWEAERRGTCLQGKGEIARSVDLLGLDRGRVRQAPSDEVAREDEKGTVTNANGFHSKAGHDGECEHVEL